MGVRKPAVAGQFYGGSKEQCLSEVEECLAEGKIEVELPESIAAGIVPHAGWVFSGALAGMVFSAIKHVNGVVDTFVIFGAAHRYMGSGGVVYDSGSWLTPLGEVEIDEELAGKIVASGLADSNLDAHRSEHSIEVQVPFIQHLFPEAKIVPIIVPPVEAAVELGEKVGAVVDNAKDKVTVCIASTDLTHYGPRYCFSPVGSGSDALKWASEVNDREFIDLALQMEPAKMLASAMEN
ncbi:MAG: AmmeMemoRadiSam system protein B, partial [Planctomycetes bacterium]|nr:AmmeMemoRadiSam system protein B [Planctomycetota bacterium]